MEPATAPTYELCIIGAGITGLNALVVATSYLGPGDGKVLLVDSRSRTGGMWVDTYDYVRLHQPHGNFTAGDISWSGIRDRSHLASRDEVLDHLARCRDVAAAKLDLEDRFGSVYVSHEEAEGLVTVTLRDPDGALETVRTRRLIKAFGHQAGAADLLHVTSNRVRSTTPERLGSDLQADRAPVWIIGSGKTAMDTAHHLITTDPGRRVSLITGPGTVFARRESFFPTGAARWWAGTPINSMLRQAGRLFDGTNETEVREWFRSTYGLTLTAEAQDFFSAYLSESEMGTIRRGLHTVEEDYFVDAVDRGDGADLVLRSGRTIATDGGWVVNCTGSLLRSAHPYEPFLSPGNRTLSVQMRSSTTGVFSAFAGYYLTHLMFTDRLASLGLYAMDMEDLAAKARPLVIYASISLALHNLSLISEALPNSVLLGCGLDYDRWYPLPRRMAGVASFLRTHRRDRPHYRRTLDTIGTRYDVRSGPLPDQAATR